MKTNVWRGLVQFDDRTTAEVTGRVKRWVWADGRRQKVDLSRWRLNARWQGIHPRNIGKRQRRSTEGVS